MGTSFGSFWASFFVGVFLLMCLLDGIFGDLGSLRALGLFGDVFGSLFESLDKP